VSDLGADVYIEAETLELENALAEYAKTSRKGIGEVLKERARLLVRDWIKFLPPFESYGSESESFATQRRIGQTAVARDIQSVFIDVRKLGIFASPKSPKAGAHAQQLLRMRKSDELQRYLVDTGYGFKPIVEEPTDAMHNARRDARGRVQTGQRHKVWVTGKGAVARFVKRKQKAVGKLKSGLMAAVNKLGVGGVPAWISSQSGRGSIKDGTSDADPFVTVRNAVSYAANSNQEKRTAELALSRRTQNLVSQIAAKLEGKWRDASRR